MFFCLNYISFFIKSYKNSIFLLYHIIILFSSVFIRQNSTICSFNAESWVVLSPIEQSIKAKIEAVGTPLKDWDINIYRGVLTGYNEAFIIDGATKEKLITEDPKSAEIIRPLLRGRDVKRYDCQFADLYIITTFPSLSIDIEEYPAVKQHLTSFGYDRLKQTGDIGARKKTNNQWFETQDSISYWEDFYKQKIIYPDIMRMPRNIELLKEYPYFYLDNENFYIEATNFMITGKNIETIYLFLLSDLGFFSFSRFYTGPQFDTTGFRYKKAYLDETYIPVPNNTTLAHIQSIIKQIHNEGNKDIDINKIWFDLVGLDEEEIQYVCQYKKILLENSFTI